VCLPEHRSEQNLEKAKGSGYVSVDTQPVHPEFIAQAWILGSARTWEESDLLGIQHRCDLLAGSTFSDPGEAGHLCYAR